MAERLVNEETPLEFFRAQLERAMEHQRVCTSAFTEHYLVHLLAEAVRGVPLPAPEPGYEETPLGLLYARALAASHAERRALLRSLGDSALFLSGFFADSLSRRFGDLAYYRCLGGRAYARLSHEPAAPTGYDAGVYGELAQRFSEFADLLAEVSELSRLASPQSVVQLYERWLQTRSRRVGRLLAERGIAPVDPGPSLLRQ